MLPLVKSSGFGNKNLFGTMGFGKMISASAIKYGQEILEFPSVIITQLGLETGWKIGGNYNLGNIKYFGEDTSASKYADGYYLQNPDRKMRSTEFGYPKMAYLHFASIDKYMQAHCSLMRDRKYKMVLNRNTWQECAHALDDSPWAEDTKYYTKIKSSINQFLKYDKGYRPHGGAIKPPPKTDANKIAVDKAKAQKIADDNAQKKLGDKLAEEDRKQDMAEAAAIKNAKLSKDKLAIKKAEDLAKANKAKRKKEDDTAKANAIKKAKENEEAEKKAYKANNPIKNDIQTPADTKGKEFPKPLKDNPLVLKSGLSIFGLLAVILLMYNVELPTTELE